MNNFSENNVTSNIDLQNGDIASDTAPETTTNTDSLTNDLTASDDTSSEPVEDPAIPTEPQSDFDEQPDDAEKESGAKQIKMLSSSGGGEEEEEDPIPYNAESQFDAPFLFSRNMNETVVMNNGNLQLTFVDLTLPGKNGHDLVIARQYDSANANDSEVVGNAGSRANTARANDHFWNMYGLGYGWRFLLSSIESVSQSARVSGITYNDTLHLSDGRSFAIERNGNTLSLKDHTLTDLALAQVSGTLHLPYHYTLTYKNGRKEYFQTINASDSQTSRLIAIDDRFGNRVTFAYPSASVIQITDTFGRVVTYTKAGTSGSCTLAWTPAGETAKQCVYTVQDKKLMSAQDPIGRVTSFAYTTSAAQLQLLSPAVTAATVNYYLLNTVTYPTGAKSVYAFTKATAQIPSPAYKDYYCLASRKDLENDNMPKNIVKYSFSLNSSWTNTNHTPYFAISYADTHLTESGSAYTRRECLFNDKRLMTGEVLKHDGLAVSEKTIAYNTDKLPTSETVKTYGQQSGTFVQKTTAMIYDGGTAGQKGNVTQIVESYSDNPDNNQTTNLEYNSAYSLLTQKTYKRDADTTLKEAYTLRSDNKAVKLLSISENDVLKHKKEYVYDGNNNVTEERVYDGAAYRNTRFQYASIYSPLPTATYISGVKNADGAYTVSTPGYSGGTLRTETVYDWYGRAIRAKDANGNITSFIYDALGRLTQETFPNGAIRQVVYDDANNRVTSTDESGYRSRVEFTSLGQTARTYLLDPDVLLAAYTYDALDRPIQANRYDGSGGIKNTTAVTYDKFNRPLQKQTTGSGANLLTAYEYDNAAESKYFRTRKTVYGDAVCPNILTSDYKDQLGRSVQQGYVIGGAERKDVSTYDKLGNRLTFVTALDASKGLGFTGKWTYDFAGRVIRSYNAEDKYTSVEYDAFGNKIAVTDRMGNTAAFTYDAVNRLLTKSVPIEGDARSMSKHYYDAAGNVISKKTQRNKPGEAVSWRQTDFVYNERNWLTDTIGHGDKGNVCTHIAYDIAGRKTEVYTGMAALGAFEGAAVTRYTYGHFGMASMTDPLGFSESYEYGATGLLLNKTDRNSAVTEYVYDSLDRPVSETIMSSENKKIGYTATQYARNGKVWQTENLNFVALFQYDELGRVITEAEVELELGEVFKDYAYDWDGLRAGFRVRKNDVTEIETSYVYDVLGRLTQVKEKGRVAATYTYDDNGNRTSVTYPNNTVTTYAYNLANRVTSVQNKIGAKVVSSYGYTYALDGSLVEKTDHTGKRTEYTYDRLGRLVKEEVFGVTGEHSSPLQAGYRHVYDYDLRGNRVKLTATGAEPYVTTYEYDLGDHLLRDTKTIPTMIPPANAAALFTDGNQCIVEIQHYLYDRNGNQVRRIWERSSPIGTGKRGYGRVSFHEDIDSLTIMEYDGYNKLISAFANKKECAYRYKPNGLRFGKKVDEHLTYHVWDGSQIVLEAVLNANEGSPAPEKARTSARYIRGMGLIAREQDGKRQYYLFNAHGDVVHRIDQWGNILKSYDYDAFGNEKNLDMRDNNPFRYCCEYYDPELKAIYLRARNYRPEYGRFLTEDPAGDGLNWYAYCSNDPVGFVDPNGLAAGTATMYENGSPKYTVDLSTGNRYALGTSLGQMSSSGGSSGGARYNLSSSNSNTIAPESLKNSALYRLSSWSIGGVPSGTIYQTTVNGSAYNVNDLRFGSEKDAATAWGMLFNRISQDAKVEYAANIYRDSAGLFLFAQSQTWGKAKSAHPIAPDPSFGSHVAYIHSHGNLSSWRANSLSTNWDTLDPSDTKASELAGIPYYASVPNGLLFKYDPRGVQTDTDRKKAISIEATGLPSVSGSEDYPVWSPDSQLPWYTEFIPMRYAERIEKGSLTVEGWRSRYK